MIISCCICCDNLMPDNDLSHLKCGHIFHKNCLTEWLNRSKSCPQCRKKTCKPTRVYPNFTTACIDEIAGEMIQSEKDNYQKNLDAKDAEILLIRTRMEMTQANHTKETNDLRNEILILEERVKDLLFEMSATMLLEREHKEKLELCKGQLSNAQIDLNGRIKLIECFERVNSQLQKRQDEIEVENNRLRENIRELSARASMKRKVAFDEYVNKYQSSKNVVIAVDDYSSDDDDCVIVVKEENSQISLTDT